MLGCTRDSGHILTPDRISHATEVMKSTDTEASFEQNILPILTARCALAGCHVADGPHGLDLRTYESFIAGGAHGPVFIPGDAAESEIVEKVVEGKMPPPPRDPLSDAQLQTIINWINQQDPPDDIVPHHHDHHDHHEEDEHDDRDDDHDDHHDDIVPHDGDHDEEDEHDDRDDDHDKDDDHDEHDDH